MLGVQKTIIYYFNITMIFIENIKKKAKSINKLYPNAEVIDVTSRASLPFVRFSPLYPHGNIPVPFSPNTYSYSVEGIWQGLKVFESTDIDISKFEIQTMKGIKRTARTFGKPIGHRKGINGSDILDYLTSRKQIYLPTYAWLLQNKVTDEIAQLMNIALHKDLVLLDFSTNDDIENPEKPLSHAALLKMFIEKKHPELKEKIFDCQANQKGKLKKTKRINKKTSKNLSKNQDEAQISMDF